ncbi:lysozyme [Ramlibacter sp. MAHUQ-53]|uniref:lysozyme n=1 Tax=unclassified Ramlibacter TaxID=2617605 RepID=UPI003632CF9B
MTINRGSVAALTLSASALIGLAVHEGFRAEAYDDGIGVQTIGFGSTSGVKRGDKTTVERALIRLGDDVAEHEAGIRRCLADVPLAQREWDAAVSLAFNIGTGAFCGSTVVKRWKAGDYAGGCDAFLMWNRAGGKVLPGLVKRREAERRVCKGEA